MNVDRVVLALAGTLTLASVILAGLHSPWWLLLAGFVGANQIQASFTGWCPAAIIARRLGVPRGCAFGRRAAQRPEPHIIPGPMPQP